MNQGPSVYTRRFGKKGEGNEKLDHPTGIAVDSNDVVYVTELGNNRVSVFTNKGEFIKTFGALGAGPGQFKGPSGIAVDKNGTIYVCDTFNNRLQVFQTVTIMIIGQLYTDLYTCMYIHVHIKCF